MHRIFLFFFFPICLLVLSCNSSYMPKPRGYFRIDFPEKKYSKFDTTFPFTFEYPVYSTIVADQSKGAEPYWINIVYKPFNAQLHISFKVIQNNLQKYLEDTRMLVNKHIPKANSITRREYSDPVQKVYGLIYEIKGSEAASACQFYVTDSTDNFVRGALYFDLVPNNDSLAPVIDFLKSDIEHMINTFKWKKGKNHLL